MKIIYSALISVALICIGYLLFWMFFYVFAALICHFFNKNNIFVRVKSNKEKQDNEHNTISKASTKGFKSKIYTYLSGYISFAQMKASKIPSFRIRNLLFRKVFRVKATPKTIFYADIEIRAPWNIKIGNSSIGKKSVLDGRYGLVIGDNVNISNNVFIWTEEHDVNDQYFRGNQKNGMVTVEDYAWLSSRSTVLPKVNIGKGAVLASNAIATKDLEPYGIYVGIPAKKRAERNCDLKYSISANKHIW